MKARTLARFILLGASAVIGLVAIEGAVRVLCTRDEDGGIKFRDTRLKPYRVPEKKADRVVAEYLATDKTSLLYDSDLGWTQRPAYADHNRYGFITTHPEPAQEPAADTLRIAVFGGSYTQGTFEHGWWRVLERELNASGIKAEVLNFGVGGYGMDQAFLRWRRDGRPWKPHVVVFGWAAGNCYDNVNLVRMVKDPDTGVPFTKPRFLREGSTLRLINSPTPPPQQLPALMHDLAAWPLIANDHFYNPGDFRMTWWRFSRLGALIEAKVGDRARRESPEQFYALSGEPAQLALAITRQFKTEVEAAGSRFYAAHLPYHTELDALRKTGRLPHADLWAAVKSSVATIEPDSAMLAAAGDATTARFFHDGHYNDEMQSVVGKALATWFTAHSAELR